MEYELVKIKHKNKKNVVFLALTLVMFLGISLAAFLVYNFQDSRANEMSTGLISIDFMENSEVVNLENIVPVIDEIGLLNDPYEFRVKNTSKVPINLKVEIETHGSTTLPLGAIRYAFYMNDELKTIDNMGNIEDNTLYLYNNFLPYETFDCKLVFWVDYYYETPGETFSAKIKVVGESFDIIHDGSTPESCFEVGIEQIYTLNQNITDDEVALCVNYLSQEWDIENNPLPEGENLESFCKGTGTIDGSYFQVFIESWFDETQLEYLSKNNIINISQGGAVISRYDINCGVDVVIPKTIKGYPVEAIDNACRNSVPTTPMSNSKIKNEISNNLNNITKNVKIQPMLSCAGGFDGVSSVVISNTVKRIYGNTFEGSGLTSVTFEENSNLKYIGEGAFADNNLTSITIPKSVEEISDGAYNENQLESVIFEEGSLLNEIGYFAFRGDNHTIIEVTIPDSVTNLDCDAFNRDVIVNKSDSLECGWTLG